MTNIVNPPPLLRIPKAFLDDIEVKAFTEQVKTILFQLYRKTGGNNDPLSDLLSTSISGFSIQEQWIQKQIDGLPELTIDTTGFTIDTTLITTDKVIA